MKMPAKTLIPERKRCAQMLQDMLDSKLSAQQVIDKWPRDSRDDSLDNIYCHLFHYRDDEDIRIKDARYADLQRNEIEAWIRELRGE